MNKKYEIVLPSGGPIEAKTDDDFFKSSFVLLCVAKRCSGKTCSLSNFLKIMYGMGKLDRVLLISPTHANNSHYF
jgi:hypothetical protein